ncbi:MAG: arginine--tRNA ligase [Chloroflexi bacterium]|nr:arginine--tRNA ligase [Chloroflexota bacterium]
MAPSMIKSKIASMLEKATATAQEKGLLPPGTLPEIMVERPQNSHHGDYACSVALKLARPARTSPISIARTISDFLPTAREIEKVEVAPPGFINFFLKEAWLAQQVEVVRREREKYGNLDLGRGSRVQVEFVSVNPTGPLHVGHGRGAILGSTLANALAAAGYAVQREYYVNDAGAQMDAFYVSLWTRYRQALGIAAEMPENGYVGQYMIDLAQEMIAEHGRKFLDVGEEDAPSESSGQGLRELGKLGVARMIAAIKEDLRLVGVEFDMWFSEHGLYEGGQYEKAMALLKDGAYVAEKEGAVWFVSTALGEDKDNVIVRTSGTPTYFASDIAYHYNKFVERGFDRVINVWGADHQGHVPRMKAVVGAMGIDPVRLQVIITQMVTLKRGEDIIRVSKRTGDLITLREVVDEVGADACRFFFLARSADSQMDFDLELAKEQSAENPVYYVQYAHARIASILRLARERGIDYADGDVSLLNCEAELTLVRKMLMLPELVEIAAGNLEPHHLPHYAQDLATSFHAFYKQCRVVSKDKDLTMARLKLVEAAKIVLARTLHLMGMTAPESM